MQVEVDHESYTQLPALAATEVKRQRGHDIFGFLSPPARYEDQVINHAAIVSQIEAEVGPYGELGMRSTYNPKTKKYVGVSDYFVPAPVIWRHDLWNEIGESPATWDHVRAAAPALKALGHPVGIGQGNDLDSNVALLSLLMCFGAFLQDESNTLDHRRQEHGGGGAVHGRSPRERRRELRLRLERGLEQPVRPRRSRLADRERDLRDPPGRGPRHALRARAVDLAGPAGPRGRLGVGQYTSVYSVWKFAKNKDVAEQFLADLCVNSGQATPESKLFNFPSFPGAYPLKQIYRAAAADTHQPRGKYSILTTVASKYTRNAGYPGHVERRRTGGARHLPDPADVRPGLPGDDERRGLGASDRERNEADLGEVAGGGQALAVLV